MKGGENKTFDYQYKAAIDYLLKDPLVWEYFEQVDPELDKISFHLQSEEVYPLITDKGFFRQDKIMPLHGIDIDSFMNQYFAQIDNELISPEEDWQATQIIYPNELNDPFSPVKISFSHLANYSILRLDVKYQALSKIEKKAYNFVFGNYNYKGTFLEYFFFFDKNTKEIKAVNSHKVIVG